MICASLRMRPALTAARTVLIVPYVKKIRRTLLQRKPQCSFQEPFVSQMKNQLWQVVYSAEPPPIVKAGSSVLRTAALPVPAELLGSQELHQLINIMIDTMRKAPGVGLAAPQIGIPLQVVVMEDREEYMFGLSAEEQNRMQRRPFGVMALINPKLRASGDSGACFFEGCLSVPGYQALVQRYTHVQVEALTPDGAPLSFEAQGWQARILQHECDHLQGAA